MSSWNCFHYFFLREQTSHEKHRQFSKRTMMIRYLVRYWWPFSLGLFEWWGHAVSHASPSTGQCCWLCNVPDGSLHVHSRWNISYPTLTKLQNLQCLHLEVFTYITVGVSNISHPTLTKLLTADIVCNIPIWKVFA